MKKITTFFFTFILFAPLAAQPRLVASHETIDMGPVVWKTPSVATFTLQNRGDSSLVLTKVLPSCGCTQVNWSKDPIQPNATANVTATYDALALGHFNKSLLVYSNASKTPLTLHLQGDVVVEKVNYSSEYPVRIGSVSIDRNEIIFDDVNRGDHPQEIIHVVNRGRASYSPELMHLPSYLTAKMQPERILGGHKGDIIVTLNSDELHSMGLTQTDIYLSRFPGDKVEDANEINVSAILLPDFSKLSAEQMQNAPKVELSAESVDFDFTSGAEKQKATLTITNNGSSNLEISSLQLLNKAITASLGRKVVKPHGTTKLTIESEARYLENMKGLPRVLMITNDPSRPKVIIIVNIKK
jgi:hypothetical protein